MRLLTHNMLHCPRTHHYPLCLTAHTCDEVRIPFSRKFIERMIPRLDWPVFVSAAQQFPDADMKAALPTEKPEGEIDDDVLMAVHRGLLEWHVIEGVLEGGGCTYLVKNGIPNLVITEVRKEEDEGMESADGSSKNSG